jgi:hypothetical protein
VTREAVLHTRARTVEPQSTAAPPQWLVAERSRQATRGVTASARAARHAPCSQRSEEDLDMKNKVAPYAENMCESGIACLLTMVQGNVLALGLSHWIVASQTGLLAGAIVGTAVVTAKLRKPSVVSLVLGVVTMLVDMAVHPATFSMSSVREAAVTGAGAYVLSLVVSRVFRRLVRRRTGASGAGALDSAPQTK